MSTIKELEVRLDSQESMMQQILAAVSGKAVAVEPAGHHLTAEGSPWRVATLPWKRNGGPGTQEPEDVQLAQRRAKGKVKFGYKPNGEISCTVTPGVPEYRSSGSPKKVSAVVATGQEKFIDPEGHELTMVITVYYVDPVAKAAVAQSGKPADETV